MSDRVYGWMMWFFLAGIVMILAAFLIGTQPGDVVDTPPPHPTSGTVPPPTPTVTPTADPTFPGNGNGNGGGGGGGQ